MSEHRALPAGVIATKLVAPIERPGTVARGGLLDRLNRGARSPVLGVFAPAGYGKTTLLAQFVARERRPVAWVSLDEGDNDPVVLLVHVAAAVDQVLSLRPMLFATLAAPGPFEPSVIYRVCSELSTAPEHVLVLDDVHLISESFSCDAIAALALHVADTSQLVLAGRGSQCLPFARLRASGRLLEIGAADLALDDSETRTVLEHAGVSASADDAAQLSRRVEGWAIGVYLAALSLVGRATLSDTLASFTGEDRYVVDYVRSEFLEGLAPADVRFLTETAILDRLSGPLCDALLQTTGSALKLEALERSNLNVVPLDRTREWYRYHHLFRDALRTELTRRDPEVVPALHRRAAEWLAGNGDMVAAVDHALAGGDLDQAERLIAPLILVMERSGRGATSRRWLDMLGSEAIERRPSLALAAGVFAALGGDDTNARRWLAAVERSSEEVFPALGAASPASGIALLRATICAGGAGQMREDAEFAFKSEPTWSPWHPVAVVLRGFAEVLAGDDVRAEALLTDGVREASRVEGRHIWALAQAQLALYALANGNLADADALAHSAREQAGLSNVPGTKAFALVASARVAQRLGDARRLAEYVAGVQLERPRLTAATAWLSALTLLELARIHVASGDSAGARTVLRQVNDLLRQRPDLGIVGESAQRLADQLRTLPINAAGASALTPAELRLLPLLPTHLSFPEIAARLFLSRHTIKTQAISIYHKLDVASRGAAVTRARELGLLDEFGRDALTV